MLRFAAALLAVSVSVVHVAALDLTPADRRRLSAAVDAALERGDIPGVAVSIVDRTSVLLETGFGVANVSSGRPMTADTLLPLGSTTKAFTSALLALLIDKHAENGVRFATVNNFIHRNTVEVQYKQTAVQQQTAIRGKTSMTK